MNTYLAIILFIATLFLFIIVHNFLGIIPSYLIAINLVMFASMMWDKRQSMQQKKFQWRIPNNYLYFLGAVGGAASGLVATRLFRHKTLSRDFNFFLVAALLIHIFILWALS